MPFDIDRQYVLALSYASGTADRNGAILDTSGWGEVEIVVNVGTVASGAVTRIRVDSDSDSAFGSAQEITGASMDIEDDDDGQVFIIPLQNVPERYIRVVIDKDTANACAESVNYVLHKPMRMPQTSAETDEVNVDSIHLWPVVGTGASASPSLSPSLSPSASSSPSASPSSSSSASDSPSSSDSLSVSLSPSDSGSASPSVSTSLSPSLSDSPSSSPSLSESLSPSPS